MKRELKIFDKPENVKRFLGGFYISLIALLIIDFFILMHPDFPWAVAPSFFTVFAFIRYVILIFIA